MNQELDEGAIGIVICNRKLKEVPENCTFCYLDSKCNKAISVDCKDTATILEKKYRQNNDRILLSSCECKENETGIRDKPQILIERTVLIPGGDYENFDIW